MMYPMPFHVSTAMMDGMAQVKEPNQFWARTSSPMERRVTFTNPLLGSSRLLNTSPTMRNDSTCGEKMIIRCRLAAFTPLTRSRARNNPRTVLAMDVTRVKRTVFLIKRRYVGSPARMVRKCSRPIKFFSEL
ncbi:hypothetical protein D3C74_402850 [compost metagenome]